MAHDVIVSGHLCLDLLPAMNHLSSKAVTMPGKLFEIGKMKMATGGSVSNTGLTLHQLGVDVGFVTQVGDDMIGQLTLSIIKSFDPNLTKHITIIPDQPSSYSVVLSPENQDRTFLHCPGTNDTFGVEHFDFALLEGVRIFHLGYPPILPQLIANDGAGLAKLYAQAKKAGAITSLDMSFPAPNAVVGHVNWSRILEVIMPDVDIFLPSIEEIVFMLRPEDYMTWEGSLMQHITRPYLRQLATELLELGAGVVGFKLGEMGFYLHTGNNSNRLQALNELTDSEKWCNLDLWHPAFTVEVSGTTGAGDSAYGGFLAALLRGLAPDEIVRFACAVGACNVEAIDAISGVQSWDATQVRINSEWKTSNVILPS